MASVRRACRNYADRDPVRRRRSAVARHNKAGEALRRAADRSRKAVDRLHRAADHPRTATGLHRRAAPRRRAGKHNPHGTDTHNTGSSNNRTKATIGRGKCNALFPPVRLRPVEPSRNSVSSRAGPRGSLPPLVGRQNYNRRQAQLFPVSRASDRAPLKTRFRCDPVHMRSERRGASSRRRRSADRLAGAQELADRTSGTERRI
jgi:hypothetical protein